MEDTYKKSKGNAGHKGVQFQLDLVAVCVLNALHSHKNWKISSENPMAGKYDDIVVERAGEAAVLIQAKHKENRRITKDQLLSENSKNADFSLPKYFFSYEEVKSKFRTITVIICTNTTTNTKGLEDILTHQRTPPDNMLYYGSDCSFYTFNEHILSDLKKSVEAYLDNNLRDRGVGKEVITDKNLKEFLTNLQFFSCYPCGKYLHQIIEESLSRLNCPSLCRNISSQEVLRKVEDWFQQPKGEYLTETRAKAMLCEIRSDKYCESLKDLNVSFNNNYLDFARSERIVHVKVNEGHLLHMLRIYSALRGDQSRTLFVNPDDAVEAQKNTVIAFGLRRYKFLIMAWTTIEDEIITNVRRILEKDKCKLVILVADTGVELAQQFGLKDICQIEGSLTFQDLSEESQERLLKSDKVLFQGEKITLRQLLHTQVMEDYTKFLKSAMLEQLIRYKEIKVGVRLLDLDEDTDRYYISRRFVTKINESGDIRNVLTEYSLYDVKEKIIVISDSAGMGKSTVITKMAATIKNTNPGLWVMKVNLSDYTKVLKDFVKRKRNQINAAELLNSLEATKMTNGFEKLVFSMRKKVVLMLDGVDEISPDYTHLVHSLLSHCQKATNFAKIFVTTRPHVDLNSKEVGLFHMTPFTGLEQRNFLTKYWMHNLNLSNANKGKCKHYAEILIDKVSSWTISSHYWQNPFTNIPMQVRILAEIFQENIKSQEPTDWDGCKEYLERNEIDPKLPEKFNIAKLYDTFVERKRDVFIEKGNPTGTGMATVALLNQFEQYMAYHRSLSVRIILPEYQEQFKTQIPKHDTEEYILKIGIVQRLDGRIQFIHRTFAEYFLANCIVEELKLQNPAANFQRLLIDRVLWSAELQIVRAFLDIILQRISLPPNIFKQYRSMKYEETNSELIFKLAEEGHVAIFRLILESLDFKVIVGRSVKVTNWRLKIPFRKKNTLNDLAVLVRQAGVNIKGEDEEAPLHLAAKGGHLEMVSFLLEQGADVNMKVSRKETALYSAMYSRNCNIVKCLVEHGAAVNVKNEGGYSALFIAVSLGISDIVAYLLEHGADVNVKDSEYDTTLLHLAAYQKNWEIVKCLVEHGVDVNISGHRKFTALHYASIFDALDTVVTLANRDIRTGDDANTVLRLATYQRNWNFVRYLVRNGADAKVKENEHCSSLYTNHLKIIECLVEHSTDVNAVDDLGRTVLHFAVQSNKIDIVEYLLQHGANINAKDSKKWSALHYATYRNNLKVVKYLVERSANINACDCNYCTPLHYAVRCCDLSVVEYLTDQAADLTRRKDFTTLNFFAPDLDVMDVVEYFLEHGAGVQGKKGNKALHMATQWNNWNIVKYLLDHGADLNARDVEGLTPLHFAAKFDKKHNAKESEDDIALHLAAYRNNRNILKYLVEHRGDVAAGNVGGRTSFHFAAAGNKMDAVEYLLEGKADVNSRKNVALLNAACRMNWNIVECLVEQGVVISDGANNSYPALHFAVQFHEMDMVVYLLEHGANVNAKNVNNETALHLATYLKNWDIIKYLVEHGADVNAVDEEGVAILHIAAEFVTKGLVEYFLEHGADIHVKDNKSRTPLHLAAYRKNDSVVKCLIEHGADVNAKDD